ncbi:hypothetical protein FB45DRAFT_207953 [Roridomyces roridus]|uniref:Uncharacterized protein n=1 Tax=Roridomyces roridus TaxID=1738132 RepID=A0AAD7CG04_9AGAR|nr:hypothetical protein FB45DRAFT_207953 [Roridomyces roridus]
MMFHRAVFAVFALLALTSAVPIDPKLQSVIAQKNNMGLINPVRRFLHLGNLLHTDSLQPSQANSNGSGRVVLSGAGMALTAAGVIVALM